MAHFPRLQPFSNYADDVAARAEGGVGNDAHQTDVAAAVHELNRARGKSPPKGDRRGAVLRAGTRARPAEDANGVHEGRVMEPGGIAPPSERTSPRDSTCVAASEFSFRA